MSTGDAVDTTPLPGYRIGREIGAGSFAKVYLGNTTSNPPRTVAIKSVLRSKLTKKLLENLESEISILKGIRHPHVVSLIDITNTGSHIHLIMEYCPLGDLSYFIKKRDKLGQDGQIPLLREIGINFPNMPGAGLHEHLVRHFLKQLASALEFLRSKNLMHRDVKPQNLLLQPPPAAPNNSLVGLPNLPLLKLADFGFARYLQTSSMAETLCGSPLYMAPEILRYEKYDASADLWSVGTVLYEMLVGKPPFRASNHVELLRRIDKSHDVIKFPSDVLLNEDIKALIRALLKRNPKDRITFNNFFANIVLQDKLPTGQVSESEIASATEQSLLICPSRTEPLADPISVPQGYRLNSEDAGDAELILSSPTFITDLIPVNTPPTQRQISIENPQKVASGPPAHLHRRETMPINHERLRLSPGLTSPISMSRRPSHKADSRPKLHKQGSSERDIRDHASHQHHHHHDSSTRFNDRDKDRDSEGEYVVIEKKTVEVNAFADAIARSPRLGSMGRKTSVQIVRAISQNSSQSSANSLLPNNATVHTLATAERRLGSSPTSALAKAINIANQKLFGGGSPPSWLEQLVHNSVRSSQASRNGRGEALGLWGAAEEALSSEEEVLINDIEGIAVRSNIVYDFAELKLRQLIPPPPSQYEDEVGAVLTNEAIVCLCDEAMVLYLKTLHLLQKNIDLVQTWMTRDSYNGASLKLNHVVQWTRDRYNEILEKAEYLQQKKATTILLVVPEHSFEEVTAEKLLYDRALEMSRGAAVHEIVGEDLSQCEEDYEISVLMLEAILEKSTAGVQSLRDVELLEDDDRKTIEKWANLTRTRLEKLRYKLEHLGTSQAVEHQQK